MIIAIYVKTTLTSISRSNDENVDVSLYHLLELWCTFQYIKSCVDILKIDCLRGRDVLGGQFLHFSKCLAKGYDWVKFELSSYCASFRDTHARTQTHGHTHTMTIPHSPDRRVRKNYTGVIVT